MQQLDHKKNVSTKYEILNDKYKNINHTQLDGKFKTPKSVTARVS